MYVLVLCSLLSIPIYQSAKEYMAINHHPEVPNYLVCYGTPEKSNNIELYRKALAEKNGIIDYLVKKLREEKEKFADYSEGKPFNEAERLRNLVEMLQETIQVTREELSIAKQRGDSLHRELQQFRNPEVIADLKTEKKSSKMNVLPSTFMDEWTPEKGSELNP